MPHPSRPSNIVRRSVLAASAVLAGTVVLAMGLNGPTVAQAAVDCVVSFGVTQTATTVTGTLSNDTIDCGGASPGKTINGGVGLDSITGTVFVDGGIGNTLTGSAGDDNLTAATATTP